MEDLGRRDHKVACRTEFVQLHSPEHDDHWCEVGLSLGELAESESRVTLGLPFSIEIEPADPEAREYDINNWLCGVVNGACYALRSAGLEKERKVVLHLVRGKLAHSEIRALADAAMLATFRICGLGEHDAPSRPAWIEQ
jgi:hypothetical protein